MGSNAVKAKDKEPKNRIQQLAREVMSAISELDPVHREQELHETRHQRQAEGIAAAKERGVQLGRSPKPLPGNFEECYQKWRDGEISMREAASACGMSKTWFRGAVTRKEQSADCAV